MEKNEFQRLLLAALVAFSLDSVAGQNSLTLTVFVEGAKADVGQAIASLFSSSDNYLKAPISEKTFPIDDEGRARIVFKNLKAGTYSVSIVYDENSDGKMNTGLFGIPSELVGFSNNVKGVFGPPSFNKTSFSLPESDSISIILNQAKE
ncbi:MAG: DUF2141 domain-containing protein [Candidatus Thiodiazotropha sp. (ex Semelilucina semeliformis)]|nr:DUF2141 domain-containing protein [Candidatus Thiodiazotropha sp. (ex Semelilucina semeliformis)]